MNDTLRKNQIERVEITDYSSEGAGIGRVHGQAVFIPGAVRGDVCDIRIVSVKSRYAWGKIEKIHTPSPHRLENDCPAFPRCGGCTLRHMDYEEELWFKQNHVQETMRRIGGAEPIFDGIIGAAQLNRYRNKAQYPVRCQDGAAVAGFYRSRSHEVVPCGDCLIESEASRILVEAVLAYMKDYGVTAYDEEHHRGDIRHIYVRTSRSGEALLCLIAARRDLPGLEALIARLRAAYAPLAGILVQVNTRRDNVILSGESYILWGKDRIEETLLGFRFSLSLHSFFQINPAQTERLYTVAADYLGDGVDELLDLYCGVGSIGICLSGKARQLTGVELVPQAVADARANAGLGGLVNARFLCADAGTAAAQLVREGYRPDAAVVDPPRKGLDAQCIEALGALAPERIVYISCNPATQARDVALLRGRGYEAVRMTAVDMFPRTPHVETVVLLLRVKDSQKVSVKMSAESDNTIG